MSKEPDARQFVVTQAKREAVPLILGLFSPSGGGKTLSALRLATGIQKVVGGEIGFVDTESRRALAYADKWNFRHVDFKAPFRSLDYLAAVRQLAAAGCKTIIVDSMSHEHEGPGGMVDYQEAELDRMAGEDFGKRERMKMLAWAKPKAARRALLNGLLQIDANLILCFRAKQTAKPVKVGNKTEVVQMGFTPIAGDEFVFECMVAALMLPGAGGVPTWSSEFPGENMMIKLPLQFRALANEAPEPMNEKLGERLATWAQGAPAKAEDPKGEPPADDPADDYQVEEDVGDDFPGDPAPDAPPADEEAPPADDTPPADAPEPEPETPASEAQSAPKTIPGPAPVGAVYFLAAASKLNDVGRRQTFKDGKAHSSALPTNEAIPVYAMHACEEAEPEIRENPENRGGAEQGGQAPETEAEQAPPAGAGFADYADAVADAKTWPEIKAAVSALTKSAAWGEAGKPMQCKARVLAHVRLMELVNSGAFKLDFISDAHAWRNYIEFESDPDALTGNRGAFEDGPAFKGLNEAAQDTLRKAADHRLAEIMAGATDAPEFE